MSGRYISLFQLTADSFSTGQSLWFGDRMKLDIMVIGGEDPSTVSEKIDRLAILARAASDAEQDADDTETMKPSGQRMSAVEMILNYERHRQQGGPRVSFAPDVTVSEMREVDTDVDEDCDKMDDRDDDEDHREAAKDDSERVEGEFRFHDSEDDSEEQAEPLYNYDARRVESTMEVDVTTLVSKTEPKQKSKSIKAEPKKRGRKKKFPLEQGATPVHPSAPVTVPVALAEAKSAAAEVKRPRGRPRKVLVAPAAEKADVSNTSNNIGVAEDLQSSEEAIEAPSDAAAPGEEKVKDWRVKLFACLK